MSRRVLYRTVVVDRLGLMKTRTFMRGKGKWIPAERRQCQKETRQCSRKEAEDKMSSSRSLEVLEIAMLNWRRMRKRRGRSSKNKSEKDRPDVWKIQGKFKTHLIAREKEIMMFLP